MRKVEQAKLAGWQVGKATAPMTRLRALEAHEAFAQGLAWYDDARRAMRMLATRYRRRVSTVAAIVAVLSPRQSVAGNLTLTHQALQGLPIGGFGANAAKARLILSRPSKASEYVTGPKVVAFYHALTGHDALVLDSWAFRAATGKDGIRGNAREAVVHAYHVRARSLGIPVSAYQAGIWCAMRQMSGFRNSTLMTEYV